MSMFQGIICLRCANPMTGVQTVFHDNLARKPGGGVSALLFSVKVVVGSSK